MIQKITSNKVELPPIWLVEDEADFNELPKGLPYIIGKKEDLKFITIYLEFQVLLKSCTKTGLMIKWLDCLNKLGYKNYKTYELNSGGTFTGNGVTKAASIDIDKFIEDQYIVNFDKLTELKILPTWLDDLKTAIETNIITEVIFDPSAFNKQLGINIGAARLRNNKKNLLILDVSGSMPDGVVKTLTNLAKLMSKKFYADVLITGGQSFIVDYEKVPEKDIVDLARIAGRSNEGEMYRAILKEYKDYGTVISFGDNDNPGYWMKQDDECNFTCETLYSLHTEGRRTSNITGYARCLKPTKETKIIKEWIDTINK